MIYDRQWFKDVRAKLDNANGLKGTSPQNDNSAPFVAQPEEAWHVYWPAASHVQYDTAPCEYLATSDFDPA